MEAVLFIGVQGSGKSTFYREHFFDTHVRISLDLLKTKHREAVLFKACLESKTKVVIDNTNATIEGRARYIQAAKGAGFTVIGYYFQTELKAAIRRNLQRKGKAAIPVGGLVTTWKRMQVPSFAEGFDRLYIVSLNDQNEFVVQESKTPAAP